MGYTAAFQRQNEKEVHYNLTVWQRLEGTNGTSEITACRVF
jgi:hypothetical protein